MKLTRNENNVDNHLPPKKRKKDTEERNKLQEAQQPRGPWHFRPRRSNQENIPAYIPKEVKNFHPDLEEFDEQGSFELLESVFADWNIKDLPKLSPGAHLQEMANFVIENRGKFTKKPAKAIFIPEEELEPTFVTLDIDDSFTRDAAFTYKLMDTFFEDFREHISKHFTRRHDVVYDKDLCNRLLHQHFPYCRTPFIEQLVNEFSGRFSTAAWFCFFVESQLSVMVRQYFMHIDLPIWSIWSTTLPEARKRRANWVPNPEEGTMANSIKEFYSEIRRFRAEYGQLFHADMDRLLPDSREFRITKEFECMVCTGKFPLNGAIHCNQNRVGHIDKVVFNLNDSGQPGTSKEETSTYQEERHSFCVECLIGNARAATQEMPLAEGGIGLKCMAADCENPILFSECRFYIPWNVRRQLNARIVEENLGAANLPNLERCKQCNFAMIIETPPEQLRVFSCKKCGAEFCRQCQRKWNDDHFGRPCNEMANNKEHKQRELENKLSNAIIRRCHRCSTPFVKLDGCNKMQCRCGATQCYLCRAKDINYAHFCQHYRNPGQTDCRQCKRKRCLLWQSEEEVDQLALKMVQEEAENA